MLKAGLTVLFASGALLTAQAQFFSPEAWGGALFGSFIGGIAGSDCHNGFSGSGAAIGAGVGLVAGAVAGEINRRQYTSEQPFVAYPAATPYVQPGYGSFYPPVDAAAHAPPRPNYAVNGTLVGAMAGGLIGSANHYGWQGAAIGAASGLVVGRVAEAAAKNSERTHASSTSTMAPPAGKVTPPRQAITAPQPPNVVSTANHRPVHQIPDAPRVPDAPTF